jgi:hypothetical protein
MASSVSKVLCGTAISLVLSVASAGTQLPQEIHIPGERVLPESLSSAKDGTIYIGSIMAATIYRVSPGSDRAEPWIKPGTDGLEAILGVFADEQSKTLWACSRHRADSAPGLGMTPPSRIFAFDLKTGKTKASYDLPAPTGGCNDMAVASNGTLYVTDSDSMTVLQLKKGTHNLATWSAEGAFGPKGGVLDGIAIIHQTVYANVLVTGKLFAVPIKVDESAGTALEVKLDQPIVRPDGMRSFSADSVLLVEQGPPSKLVRVDLKGSEGTITQIKEGYPDGAVAVTRVDDMAYVLEGQFKAAHPDPAYTPQPFHATAVMVGRP